MMPCEAGARPAAAAVESTAESAGEVVVDAPVADARRRLAERAVATLADLGVAIDDVETTGLVHGAVALRVGDSTAMLRGTARPDGPARSSDTSDPPGTTVITASGAGLGGHVESRIAMSLVADGAARTRVELAVAVCTAGLDPNATCAAVLELVAATVGTATATHSPASSPPDAPAPVGRPSVGGDDSGPAAPSTATAPSVAPRRTRPTRDDLVAGSILAVVIGALLARAVRWRR